MPCVGGLALVHAGAADPEALGADTMDYRELSLLKLVIEVGALHRRGSRARAGMTSAGCSLVQRGPPCDRGAVCRGVRAWLCAISKDSPCCIPGGGPFRCID